MDIIEEIGTPEVTVSETLPLLPLKNVVMLPKSIIPITVGREISIRAVEFALKHNHSIFITAQKNPKTEEPSIDDLFLIGTRSNILRIERSQNGVLRILAESVCRAKMTGITESDGFFSVTYTDMVTPDETLSVELNAIWRQLSTLYLDYAKLNDKASTEIITPVNSVADLDYITDIIAMHSNLSFNDRQAILEIPDLKERMLKLCSFLKKESDILQTEQRIQGHIHTQYEKNQREYYLHEQLKAIQKELGKDDHSSEIEQIRANIKKLGLPKDALEKVQRELKRLEQMPPLSSEAVVSRNYIDWIIALPWQNVSQDTISLTQAERILDANHAGLRKAKDRIIEFLAAKKFSKTLERSPIICLVGPPGVGKTSLGKSIADSLGREFVRISLGGIRDEAEIRGHRRTYIGALPGKIIQAMRKANTMNPVILLDEIDKMSRDMHGDPAAALLEVLDPEQNKTFSDHFLDVEYDLSKVMFITTANVLENIPYALFDRLEVISLSGYTDKEKLEITKQFLIPKNLREYSLTKAQFKISDDVINHIIAEYTKEAGVRQLERVFAKLMRKVIQILLQEKKKASVTITDALVKEWLGNPSFKKTSLNPNVKRIGLSTGLAWTEIGGDVLEIEVSVLNGKGSQTLTGQLGDVMQESAQAALSYIRSRAEDLGLKPSFYTNKDIHIHIPEGATPKDGPSAGISICTAVVSALTGIPTQENLAMTGEITLQGRVLAVGGLKEKLLAAIQHNMKKVIVPKENFHDIEEVAKEISLEPLHIVYATTMDEVLHESFVKTPFKKNSMKKKTKAKTKKSTVKKTE